MGDDDAVARLVDLQAPVDLVRSELAAADSWGALRFLPAERAAGQLEGHHWVPDIAPLPVDDAWDPMDLLCGLLHDGNGRLRGLLSVDLPINGRRPDQAQRETLQMYVRLAERALITALERGDLEEKVEEEQALAEYRRGIIDVLTHELRGSVGAIANTVVYLRGRHEWTDLDGVESALRIVEGGAQRIRSVVEDMSALTELGKTDIRLRTELCDLGRIARDAVELHAVSADLQHIDLRCDAVGDAIVLGDPNDLDRMVGNLVSNAVKYSDQGGRVEVRVESRDHAVEPTAILTVADEGIGISDTDQAHLFEEFFRSRDGAVRRRPGTGLGLAIVHRIVTLHDGAISVDSGRGRGSTFTVELPAARATTTRGKIADK